MQAPRNSQLKLTGIIFQTVWFMNLHAIFQCSFKPRLFRIQCIRHRTFYSFTTGNAARQIRIRNHKSTLGYVLTGNPKYSVTEGKILFKGNDITEEAADKRAKAGMFLSFQEPLEVPGLSLESFIRSALSEQGRNKMRVWNFRKELKAAMEVLHMDPSYAGRDLNVGFSGGEKKKSEILQLMMLKPDLAILDETDSGLDVDAVRLASEGIREYQKENPDGALLIITHSTRILDALHVDATHIMVNGHIVASGDASLVDKINREGYEEYEKLAQKGEDER